MNETTELIMKQLNAKKVHAETHELGGGDEIDVTKLKNVESLETVGHSAKHEVGGSDEIDVMNLRNVDNLVTKTGDFQGTWNGITMTSTEPGLSSAFDALKAETVPEKISYVTGLEYLNPWHNKIRQGLAVKMIWGGDSTTAGVNIVSSSNYVDQLAKKLMMNKGYSSSLITTVNAGVGGSNANDWVTLQLASAMSQNPDLYVVRFGINDSKIPSVGTDEDTRVATFETNLRLGLSQIRGATYNKPVNTLPIILCTPNYCDSPSINLVPSWFEKIRKVIKQAAADFQCAYVDIYGATVAVSSFTSWSLDAIHPTDTTNNYIMSLFNEALLPSALANNGASYVGKAATAIVYASNSAYKPPSANTSIGIYICDGTDDDEKIRDATTAVNAAGGGRVILMDGDYNVSGSIAGASSLMKSNIVLEGQGEKTNVILQQDTNIYFLLSGLSNVVMRNFKITKVATATNPVNTVLIEVSNSSNVTIDNVTFDADVSLRDVYNVYITTGSKNVTVKNCKMTLHLRHTNSNLVAMVFNKADSGNSDVDLFNNRINLYAPSGATSVTLVGFYTAKGGTTPNTRVQIRSNTVRMYDLATNLEMAYAASSYPVLNQIDAAFMVVNDTLGKAISDSGTGSFLNGNRS